MDVLHADHAAPMPIVIPVGGAEPGIYGWPAPMLASEEFVFLALAHFDMPGLPGYVPVDSAGAIQPHLQWFGRRGDVLERWRSVPRAEKS